MTSETLKTYFASLILTHPLIAPEAHRMGAPQSAGPRGCGWPHVQDGHDGFHLWRQQRGTSQSGEVGCSFTLTFQGIQVQVKNGRGFPLYLREGSNASFVMFLGLT